MCVLTSSLLVSPICMYIATFCDACHAQNTSHKWMESIRANGEVCKSYKRDKGVHD